MDLIFTKILPRLLVKSLLRFKTNPMSTLDMDLIFTEILPRLPVKSLMRFKCVSKSFNFEISSRNFSQLYLRYHSPSSDDDLLILLGKRGMLCYDLDLTTNTSTPISIPISASTSTFKSNGGFVRGVGSCNGLLCIVMTKNGGEYFSALNPTTRICQDIPLPDNDLATGKTGFAFDPENLDYKIVCISIKSDTLITKVYSFNANSWKILEFPFPNDTIYSFLYPFIDSGTTGTLVNNNLLHWTFWIPSVRRQRISCFDVCKNEWTYDVLFPHYYYDPDHNNILSDIAVINDKLCSSFENRDDYSNTVWMMNEYGVQDSWVKLMTIHDSWGLLPVAHNREYGRLLVPRRDYYSPVYTWCDSLGRELTTVTFDGAQHVINEDHFTFTCCRGLGFAQRVIKHQTFICKRSFVHLPYGHLFQDP